MSDSRAPAPPARAEVGLTVLVVDDEPLIRQLMRRILEEAGYRVLEAGDGEEALRLVGERADSLVLVLTDLRMPNIGGREVFEIVSRFEPTLPVLAMSGHPGPQSLPSRLDGSEVRVLRKPFGSEHLLVEVRECSALRRAGEEASLAARRRIPAIDLVEEARALQRQFQSPE